GGFFFQAEDGIRDFHVTGVQTCALPILAGETLSCWLVNRWYSASSASSRLVRSISQRLLSHHCCCSASVHCKTPGGGYDVTRLRSEERRVGRESGAGCWGSRA